MPYDELRAALFALLSHPIAVASLILLAGVNAAIWLLVFERAGFPTVLASLLLLPPLNFVLPLYVALARWPSERLVRFPTRQPGTARPRRRVVQRRPFTGPVPGEFDHRRPLRLDSNGLPLFRIPLPPSTTATAWPGGQALDPRYLVP